MSRPDQHDRVHDDWMTETDLDRWFPRPVRVEGELPYSEDRCVYCKLATYDENGNCPRPSCESNNRAPIPTRRYSNKQGGR